MRFLISVAFIASHASSHGNGSSTRGRSTSSSSRGGSPLHGNTHANAGFQSPYSNFGRGRVFGNAGDAGRGAVRGPIVVWVVEAVTSLHTSLSNFSRLSLC